MYITVTSLLILDDFKVMTAKYECLKSLITKIPKATITLISSTYKNYMDIKGKKSKFDYMFPYSLVVPLI